MKVIDIDMVKPRVERMGVAATELTFSAWGWLFRGQDVADYGIDAHVETMVADGEPSGRLIALQIKAGSSFSKRKVEGGWTYRGKNRHLRYWLGHVLPVVLVIYNEETKSLYWQHVTSDRVEYTEKAWTILIPEKQTLDAATIGQLMEIADSAAGAIEDPIEATMPRLPPTARDVLTATRGSEPDGALRLTQLLARGRLQPRLTVETILSGQPSWLTGGSGQLEAALGAYANEHGSKDLAVTAFVRAAEHGSPDAGRLYGIAGLLAIEAGDPHHASTLLDRAETVGGGGLLGSVARAYLDADQNGATGIEQVLSNASPEQLNSEPTCLMFLAEQCARRRNFDAAIRHFEAVISSHPNLAGARLGLARTLIGKVVEGKSAIPLNDQRRAQLLATEVRDEVRQWSGPSERALVMMLQDAMVRGAYNEILELVTPQALGGSAVEREASSGEVVIYGAQAALALGDSARAARFADVVRDDEAAATFIRALTADKTLPPDDRIALWRAGLGAARTHEHVRRALYQLAALGASTINVLEEHRRNGVIDETQRDVYLARSDAAQGRTQQAVEVLRRTSGSDPATAEVLVEVLAQAGLIEEALAECDLGVRRFGAAKFAYDKLNILATAGRLDEANELARQLLACPDLAVEQRLALRRELVSAHAQQQRWARVEQESREALAEQLDTPDLAWWMIAAQFNQGRIETAWSTLKDLNPEIDRPGYVGLWMDLHNRFGWSEVDVQSALGFISEWQRPEFVAQVLGTLLKFTSPAAPDQCPALTATTTALVQSAVRTFKEHNPAIQLG
ncbi:DUF4365 domain-containing protein [Longispora urticae]